MSTAGEADDRGLESSVAEPELGPEARMGAAMKAAREAKGLSRRAFVSQIYMSHSNLAEYENGHRLAPAHVVESYEGQLGLAAGSLLGQWERARVELYGEMRDRRPRWVPPAVAGDAVGVPPGPRPLEHRNNPPPGPPGEGGQYQAAFTVPPEGPVIGDHPVVNPFFSSPPPSSPTPTHFGPIRFRLPRVVEHFVGRDTELDALESALGHGHQAVITQSLTGLGGVGKSQLAAAYVARHAWD